MKNEDSVLSVEKLLKIRKDFLEKFPPRDQIRDTAMFANWFHAQYGMKIIPKDVPDDCIGVSPTVYAHLIGILGEG